MNVAVFLLHFSPFPLELCVVASQDKFQQAYRSSLSLCMVYRF